MPAPSQGSAAAPAQGVSNGRDPSRRKLGIRTGRLKQMNQHHPYRIELLDVTPVSVSLLWSIRPPPLSAIPQGVVTTPLRQRFQARTLSQTQPETSATATAVATSSAASAAANAVTRSTKSSSPASTSRNPAHQPSDSTSSSSSARASPAPTHAHEPPIHKLAEGLIATRSLNRKVTKIRLRAPPSVSAHTSSRRPSHGSNTPDSAPRPSDEDAWPSDDGATAVEDDDDDAASVSASDASDSALDRNEYKSSSMVVMFEDRVNVVVDGKDWPHVLMGERGSHEAIVVIFGLEPESDYDIQFEVRDTVAFPHTVLRTDSANLVSSVKATTAASLARPASPSPLARLAASNASVGGHTSTDSDADSGAHPQKVALLKAELQASEALRAELLAELRKVRKETSKAESGLRHEIEAVKRGLDRMSATDHRSKQKVLALQETIKQTTVHVREIHQEAQDVEDEQPDWEEQEAAVSSELEELRKQVQDEEKEVNAQLDADSKEIAAAEQALKKAEAAVKSKEAERDMLKDTKLAGIRAEIEKLRAQIADTSLRPQHGRRGGGYGVHRGGNRHVSGPTQFVPSQTLPRAKGPHALGHPSGRGGRHAHNHAGRAASGPASQGNGAAGGGGGAALANSLLHGSFRPFVPGASRFRGTQAQASPTTGWGSQMDYGTSNSIFDPTNAEVPYGRAFGYGAGPESLHNAAPYGYGGFSSSNPNGHDNAGFAQDTQAVSPPGSERRSSLPLPQLLGKPGSALNPYNPEFVPGASSANASPILAKNTLHSNATSAWPGPPFGSSQNPPVSSAVTGVASVEHSPTASSRFAFPLARQAGTAALSKAPAAVPSPIGSDRQAIPLSAAALSGTIPSASSQLFPPPGVGAAGSSPLLTSSAGTASAASTSPLLFNTASPRFGQPPLPEEPSTTGITTDSGLASSGKFGPLDYDPSMDDFGPAPGLGAGSRFGSGGGSSSSNSAAAAFGSSALPPLFGASDTWGAPSSTAATKGAASREPWVAPSPPLGGGLTDIWSAPSLPGVRNKLSLGDLGTRAFGGGAGPGKSSLGPIGKSQALDSLMNLSAPVSPTSPTHLNVPPPPLPEAPNSTAPSTGTPTSNSSSFASVAAGPNVLPSMPEDDP